LLGGVFNAKFYTLLAEGNGEKLKEGKKGEPNTQEYAEKKTYVGVVRAENIVPTGQWQPSPGGEKKKGTSMEKRGLQRGTS